MEVLILTPDYKFRERGQATYKNGALFFARGQIVINLYITKIKFGGEIMELEFDYSKTIDQGKDRLAIYIWDGKNARQISFKDTFSNSTMVDYKNQWALSKLMEETALKPPPENKWLKYGIPLAAISIIISCLAFIYTANHVINQFSHALNTTPAVNISQQNAKLLNYIVSRLNATDARDTAIINAYTNLSAYLSRH